jgi:hypothetical protein
MERYVIDCCSLINLYTGWNALTELQSLQNECYVCDAVIAEAQYTRDIGPDGKLLLVPLDLGSLVDAGLLLQVKPESERELQDYVDRAVELDDGEAQALAIAKNRSFTLVTDERKASRIARSPGVEVNTVSTVHILRQWADISPKNAARLPEILKRIAILARFVPTPESTDYAWWKANSGA